MGGGVGILAIGAHIRAGEGVIDEEETHIAAGAGLVVSIEAGRAGGVTLYTLIEGFFTVVAFGAVLITNNAQVEVDGAGDILAGVAICGRSVAGRAGWVASGALFVGGPLPVADGAAQSTVVDQLDLEECLGGVERIDAATEAVVKTRAIAGETARLTLLAEFGAIVCVVAAGADLEAVEGVIEEIVSEGTAALQGAVVSLAQASNALHVAVGAPVGVLAADILTRWALSVAQVRIQHLVVVHSPIELAGEAVCGQVLVASRTPQRAV